MSSFDEMRIFQKEADLAKKKLQEVENAGEVASQSGIKRNAKNKYISVNFLDEGKEAAYTKTTEQRR